MQTASAETVLGDFGGTTFTYGAITSTFFKKEGAYYVRTDGPDGTLHEYHVAYTLGVYPLQQYLIEFPGGRLQALGIAWDARPASAGGRRWFHLYPDENVDHRDVLHWTGSAQNWNFMCAECHSTNVRKNYRPEEERYETTYSEVDVSCEACHGPASAHVAWANLPEEERRGRTGTKGLVVDLGARGGSWVLDGTAAIARLDGARDTRVQMVCGRCHARRALLSDDDRQDRPLDDAHLVSVLEEGLFESDGQILDEVFEYGSFLQSRMHERGVVCSDCHDSHSGRLRAEGNAVCAKCHQPIRYDTPEHHHHKPGTKAASCVACHMPSRTYMVVHERHDHGFRVPRPDLSATLGTPNACAACHADRPPQWAAEAVVGWYGATRTRGPRWAPAIRAGRRHEAAADRNLVAIVRDRSHPAIVRATAISLISDPAAAIPQPLADALGDPDPLVRRHALSLLRNAEPRERWQSAGPLLADPSRIVRLEAVNTVADTATLVSLNREQRATFDATLAEYRAVQAFNADRADAWLNLGSLEARLGNAAAAETHYRRGMRLQRSFMPNYLNLADLYRAQARDGDAERVLREALSVYAGSADVHHSLGLTLVRQRRIEEAIAELATATKQAPDNPRYAYVYAVALESVGRRADAVLVLEAAQRRFSGDRDILAALLQWSLQAGDRDAALAWSEKLGELDRK